MGFFGSVTHALPDAIFGLTAAFVKDKREEKVNLTVGYYRDEHLKTPLLACVRKAEGILLENGKSKEYLPFSGNPVYVEKAGGLTFGERFWKDNQARIYGAQSVGGTGALRLAGDFLKQEMGTGIYIPDPSWPNHLGVFTRAGLKVATYPYYDRKTHGLDFDRMVSFFNSIPEGSVVVLHARCHNPTGVDLKREEWKVLSSLFLEKKIIPFFDSAYQGFDKSLEEDVEAIRLFAEEGHEMFVACSYAKNFSIYGERAGVLFVVTPSAENVGSKIDQIVRTTYSNPPLHGAGIVAEVLSNPSLRKQWEEELGGMRKRIHEMRRSFVTELSAKSKRDFSYLEHRAGLFCYTGLTKEQADRLIAEFGIYMTGDGRINIAGLNAANLDYVIKSICHVL